MVLEPKNVNGSNRRHFSPEKKFEIVKEVLVGKVPVSEVCKKYNIDTRQYYTWQKKFFR
jgi:transposase-like protein